MEYFEDIINDFRFKSIGDLCSLSKNCLLKIGFVKGWGEKYSKYINETPVWMEIRMLAPLKLLKLKYDAFFT